MKSTLTIAQQQKPSEAERFFRLALAASSMHIGAHINLGKLLLTMNQTTEALKIFQSAHALAPDRAEINLNLATLYADRNDYQRALDAFYGLHLKTRKHQGVPTQAKRFIDDGVVEPGPVKPASHANATDSDPGIPASRGRREA